MSGAFVRVSTISPKDAVVWHPRMAAHLVDAQRRVDEGILAHTLPVHSYAAQYSTIQDPWTSTQRAAIYFSPFPTTPTTWLAGVAYFGSFISKAPCLNRCLWEHEKRRQ